MKPDTWTKASLLATTFVIRGEWRECKIRTAGQRLFQSDAARQGRKRDEGSVAFGIYSQYTHAGQEAAHRRNGLLKAK